MDEETFKLAGHGVSFSQMLLKHHLELHNAATAPKHRFMVHLEGQAAERKEWSEKWRGQKGAKKTSRRTKKY